MVISTNMCSHARISHPAPGVPEALIQEMFTYNDNMSREGLGLYISQKLVRIMNGTVQYIREADKASFIIKLEFPFAQKVNWQRVCKQHHKPAFHVIPLLKLVNTDQTRTSLSAQPSGYFSHRHKSYVHADVRGEHMDVYPQSLNHSAIISGHGILS